jgi:hypothetical protein
LSGNHADGREVEESHQKLILFRSFFIHFFCSANEILSSSNDDE